MTRNSILMSEYEQKLRLNPEDLEARFQLVMTRYEAVNVDGNYYLGRYDLQDIIDDRDTKELLKKENDEGIEKKYLPVIKSLYSLQTSARNASNTDKACDVYLAYDSQSKESVSIAEEIYRNLSSQGVSVYFEPEMNNTGMSEIHRLVALTNSKVLVLVGTEAKELSSPDCKSAWMRYLNMMDRDNNKHLLPAYRQMRPEDFPDNLSKIQGIDLGRIGSIQSILVTKVKELIGKDSPVVLLKKENGKTVNISNILRRIEFLLEDEEWDEADSKLASFAKEYGPDYEQYHYLRLLCAYEAKNDEVLLTKYDKLMEKDPDFKYLIENGSEEIKQLLGGLSKAKLVKEITNKENELVETVEKAHINGDYELVLRMCESLKANTNFSRWGEVEGFYRLAIDRVEESRIVKQYKTELGDPDKYYMNLLAKREPEKYKLLKNPPEKQTVDFGNLSLAIAGMVGIAAVILAFIIPAPLKTMILVIGLMCAMIGAIIKRITDGFDSVVAAIIKGVLITVVIPFAIVVFLSVTDLIGCPDSKLLFVSKFFAFLSRTKLELRNEYFYEMEDLIKYMICYLGIFTQIFKTPSAYKKYKQNSGGNGNAIKQYNELMKSGFLDEFQTNAYNELAAKYKDKVGYEWIEPKKMF